MEQYRKLIESHDIASVENSLHLDLLFEMAARYGKMWIIRNFIDNVRINSNTRYMAFTNACKYGQREIAKFIFDTLDNNLWAIDIFSMIRQMVIRGHIEMIYDYSEFLLNSAFGDNINKIALNSGKIEAVKVFDNIGTGIVCQNNLTLAVESKSREIVEYFHKKGVRLDREHLVLAENIKAYDVVFYFVENGLEPTTQFYKRYVTFRKKVKENRERKLGNMVYYVLIDKIYTPGTESAKRLAWASYNASMEGRVL